MNYTLKLNQLLKRVEKPGRYIGGEINSVKKDPEKVRGRFAFCFPNVLSRNADIVQSTE